MSPTGTCPGLPSHRSLFASVPDAQPRRKGRKTPSGRGALIRRLRRVYGLTVQGAQLAADAGNWRFWGVTTADAAAVHVKWRHLPRCARPFSRRPMGYHQLQCLALGLVGF